MKISGGGRYSVPDRRILCLCLCPAALCSLYAGINRRAREINRQFRDGISRDFINRVASVCQAQNPIQIRRFLRLAAGSARSMDGYVLSGVIAPQLQEKEISLLFVGVTGKSGKISDIRERPDDVSAL